MSTYGGVGGLVYLATSFPGRWHLVRLACPRASMTGASYVLHAARTRRQARSPQRERRWRECAQFGCRPPRARCSRKCGTFMVDRFVLDPMYGVGRLTPGESFVRFFEGPGVDEIILPLTSEVVSVELDRRQ